MPNNVVKSYADKSGKSVTDVEKMWKEIEASVMKDPKYKDYDKDRKFAIVNGIVKKELKIKEDVDDNRSNRSKLLDKLEEKISRKKINEGKEKDLVVKSNDVISHVNQALDVLKDLKKAPGAKGERFKYFSTYLSNFLSNDDEMNPTGFVPFVSELESEIPTGEENTPPARGGESDELEMDADDTDMADDEAGMEESAEEINAILSEGVDKKGIKIEFTSLPEEQQNAIKEFGLKSKVVAVVRVDGEKSSFVKIFLDLGSLGKETLKKMAESPNAPIWVSSHHDKVVLGYKAAKKKAEKKEMDDKKKDDEKKIVDEDKMGYGYGSPKKKMKTMTPMKKEGEEIKEAFTKQHYIAIANTLKDAKKKANGKDAVEHITNALTDMFKKDNGLFDANKFKQAVMKEAVDDNEGKNNSPVIGNLQNTRILNVNKEDIGVAEANLVKAKEALENHNLEMVSDLLKDLKVTVACNMNLLAGRMSKSHLYSEEDAKFLIKNIEKFIKDNKANITQ